MTAARADGRTLYSGPRHHAWRGDAVGYRAAHLRIECARGRADAHRCVDCGKRGTGRQMAWCLVPGSPQKRTDRRTGLRFSIDPADYVVRCTGCHILRDLMNRTGRGPKLAEIAAWILYRIEQAGGRIPTSVIYSEAKALGIADDKRLSAARTYCLPNRVVSDRRSWWLVPDETEMVETG